MRLRDYVHPDLILAGMSSPDKGTLLRQLSSCLAEKVPGVHQDDLYERLERREAEASTGVGNGIAIPHATMEDLDRTICALVQAPEGVEFGSVDHQPVRFLFVLLSPPRELGPHVRLMAQIARLASETSFVRKLSRAKDAAEIYRLIQEPG